MRNQGLDKNSGFTRVQCPPMEFHRPEQKYCECYRNHRKKSYTAGSVCSNL